MMVAQISGHILVDCKLQASAARMEAPVEKVRTVS